MPGPLPCPDCGSRIPAGQPTCPACDFRRALSFSESSGEALIIESVGDRVGPFLLVERLGEGGFGVVFRALQTEGIKREVAIKILKLGMDTHQFIARFRAEWQILGMMSHSGIAKVYEPGSTESGRPYFAMELVQGPRITDYCDQKNLTLRERLVLFVSVCRAVHHAHQKGIIHRDLKPPNILVAVEDGKPVPKIIDFGVARATAGPLSGAADATSVHQFFGTPAYMSPEQAGAGTADLDTRSDIYALGVLLYELLTGHIPFDHKEFVHANFDRVREFIRDREPPKPSTRLVSLPKERLFTIARRQCTDSSRLISQIRGDLDWIIMKCLEKERDERYETANALILDIQRHLNSEPVTAVAAKSAFYRARKYVRKHRITLSVALGFVLLLIAGLAASVSEAIQARKAERKATTVATFLADAMNGVTPSIALGRDTTLLKEILDNTARRIETGPKDQPELEADLRSTIGRVYDEIGALPQAEAMHSRALALRRATFGEKSLPLADSLADLGSVREAQGRPAEAETLLRQALAIRRELSRAADPEIARVLANIATSLVAQGKIVEAETYHQQALEIRRKAFGDESIEVANSLHNIGNMLWQRGQLTNAEATYRRSIAIGERLFGPDFPDSLTTTANLATVLWSEGKLQEAESLYRKVLSLHRKLLGKDHPNLAMSLHNLACVLQSESKLPEAETACREALEMRRRLLGNDHPAVGSSLSALAAILESLQRYEEAEKAQREALSIQQKLPDSNPLETAVSLNNLGDILRLESRLAEAETAQREALAILTKQLGAEHQFVAVALNGLANVLRDQGHLPDAERVQRESLNMRRKLLGDRHLDVAQSLNDLATVLLAEKDLANAESACREAISIRDSGLGETHPNAVASRKLLDSILAAKRKLEGSASPPSI